ncbi:MAG: hypothetical protein OEZ39_11255 [Gammaproteobacteria bacterium]|nr:hypothetical protein [Gammaproteobacteria bacterium]MDH5652419.1 hypothetical protein [Gammaproteobacteria bacterium]
MEKELIIKRSPAGSDPDVRAIYRLKQEIEAGYGVKVHINKKCSTYWGRYNLAVDNKRLLTFMQMMHEEIRKYPVDFFRKSRAENICIGENLSVNGITVAAMPAPENNIVIYSLARDVKSTPLVPYKMPYMRTVFHHELFHNTDYVVWGKHYYKWAAWHALNVPGFTYSRGGVLAYTNPKMVKSSRLEKGFMNKYSQLGMEEDRAEIMEAIMMYPGSKLVINKCRQDEIIRNKVNLIVKLLDDKIIKQRKWHIHEVADRCNSGGDIARQD